mgnify:FL=1
MRRRLACRHALGMRIRLRSGFWRQLGWRCAIAGLAGGGGVRRTCARRRWWRWSGESVVWWAWPCAGVGTMWRKWGGTFLCSGTQRWRTIRSWRALCAACWEGAVTHGRGSRRGRSRRRRGRRIWSGRKGMGIMRRGERRRGTMMAGCGTACRRGVGLADGGRRRRRRRSGRCVVAVLGVAHGDGWSARSAGRWTHRRWRRGCAGDAAASGALRWRTRRCRREGRRGGGARRTIRRRWRWGGWRGSMRGGRRMQLLGGGAVASVLDELMARRGEARSACSWRWRSWGTIRRIWHDGGGSAAVGGCRSSGLRRVGAARRRRVRLDGGRLRRCPWRRRGRMWRMRVRTRGRRATAMMGTSPAVWRRQLRWWRPGRRQRSSRSRSGQRRSCWQGAPGVRKARRLRARGWRVGWLRRGWVRLEWRVQRGPLWVRCGMRRRGMPWAVARCKGVAQSADMKGRWRPLGRLGVVGLGPTGLE